MYPPGVLTPRGFGYLSGLTLCAGLLVPSAAQAHFVLTSPASMNEQNGLGDPQKAAPCGDDGGAVATNMVTTYQEGDTLTLTLTEMIPHPGHYRVALALEPDLSDLPPEPIVTPGATPCGSAPIDPAPVFPVLADGVFEHDSPLVGEQSIDITLPAGVTCDNCTLQVIEFMSDHALNDPGGCYYHHCAAISIEGVAGTSGADGGESDDDGGMDTATTMTSADGSGDDGGADDGTAGGADDGPDDGADDGADDAGGTAATAGVGTGGAANDDGGDDGGCSCSAPTDGRSPVGGLLGFLGAVALGLRTRRRSR